MKRTTLFLALVAALCFGAPALAFHDGGVADCAGCHTMHGSGADNGTGNPYLLTESTPTDTCIACHGTRLGNSFDTDPLAPGNQYGGGNFVFLLEDNINDGHAGASNPILGHAAGHSVISDDRGTAVDPVNATAPGGTYPASNMHCSSCHDPHGKTGSFRLLYGTWNGLDAGDPNFWSGVDAPDADGISFFGAGENNGNHTAYRDGYSEWCGACHGDYHNTSYPTVLKHPSGAAIGGDVAFNYNQYNGTGTYTNGPDMYLAEVPFEDAANTTSYTGLASATSKVMCASCHRAHASSAQYAGRWDFSVTFLVEDGDESGSYEIPNPYAATAGASQRSLCNKCHAQDPRL